MVKIRIPKPQPTRLDLEAEINRLKHELETEKSSTKELRASIDVIQIGWDLDKQKLLEAITNLDKALILKPQQVKKKPKVKPGVCTCMRVGEENVESESGNENRRVGNLLTCTLCCNKTYRSLELFQKHLQNVGENLACPFCKETMCLCTLRDHLEKGCDSTENLFPINCKSARRQVSSKEVETQTDSFLRLPDQDLYATVSVKVVEITDKSGVKRVIPHFTMKPLPEMKANVQHIKKISNKSISSLQTRVPEKHIFPAHGTATSAVPCNNKKPSIHTFKKHFHESKFKESRKKTKRDSIIEHSYAMKNVKQKEGKSYSADSIRNEHFQTTFSDDKSPPIQLSENIKNESNSEDFKESISINRNNEYKTNSDIVEESENALNLKRKCEKKAKPDRKLPSRKIVKHQNVRDEETMYMAKKPNIKKSSIPLKLPFVESPEPLEKKMSQENSETSPSLNTRKKISSKKCDETYSKISSSPEKTVHVHKKHHENGLNNESGPSNFYQPVSVNGSNTKNSKNTSNSSSSGGDDFYCSACEVFFKSVAQHVNTYHADEEVEVEPEAYKEVLDDLQQGLVCKAGVQITEKVKKMLLNIPKNITGQKRKSSKDRISKNGTTERNKKMKLNRKFSEANRSKKKYLYKEGVSKTENVSHENGEKYPPIQASSDNHLQMLKKRKDMLFSDNHSEKLSSKKLDQFQEILKLENANKFLKLPHCEVVLNDIGLNHSLMKGKSQRELESPLSEDRNESIIIKKQCTKKTTEVGVPLFIDCNKDVLDVKQISVENNKKDGQTSLITDNVETCDEQKQPSTKESNMAKEPSTDNEEHHGKLRKLSTGEVVDEMNNSLIANTNKNEEFEKNSTDLSHIVWEVRETSTDNNKMVLKVKNPSAGISKGDIEKKCLSENKINMNRNESSTVDHEMVCENSISVLESTEEVNIDLACPTEGVEDFNKSTKGTMSESEDCLENQKEKLKSGPEELENLILEKHENFKDRLEEEEDYLRESGAEVNDQLNRSFNNEASQSETFIKTSGNGYKCNLCSNEFTSLRQAEKHILLHYNKDAFHCFSCSSVYPIKLLLQEHIRNEHGKGQGQY